MPPLSPFSKSCIALAVSQLMLTSQISNAATITVDTNADDDGSGCTLRETIVSANTDVDQGNGCAVGSAQGTDTITFDNSSVAYFPSNTIELLSGNALSFNESSTVDVEINASNISGGVTLQANGLGGVFDFGGKYHSVTLDNMTIAGGSGSYGGVAYFDDGIVTLNNCTVTNNQVSGNGGAFSVGSGGHLVLNNTTVSENFADKYGGAIEVYNGGNLTVTNSTISSNSSTRGVSAIFSYGSDSNYVNIISSTITNNTSIDSVGA